MLPFSREETFTLLIGAQFSSNGASGTTDAPLSAGMVGKSNAISLKPSPYNDDPVKAYIKVRLSTTVLGFLNGLRLSVLHYGTAL